jgi:Uma2 family endonuclease
VKGVAAVWICERRGGRPPIVGKMRPCNRPIIAEGGDARGAALVGIAAGTHNGGESAFFRAGTEPMSYATQSNGGTWTAVDLVERFGAIPLNRVVQNPPPGTATEQDVIDLDEHEDRLCELIDGTLVEKTAGAYESFLAAALIRLLGDFIVRNGLGVVLGEAGMMRLAPGLVRIPDVSFISLGRLPDHRMPREPIANLVPDLAVEVISSGNTRREMDSKLQEYFTAGVRLVWYVYHTPRREVYVYVSPTEYSIVHEGEMLDGGTVLPGFRVAIAELFAEPAGPKK